MLAPLVRRTWAPRGQTPILRQPGRSRQKVSVIAGVTVAPRRRRVGLYFALYPQQNICGSHLVAFLRHLRRMLQRDVIIVWDRLNAHAGTEIQVFLYRNRWAHIEFLPAYAPELNPSEMVWGYTKMNPLANLVATDARGLARTAQRKLRTIARRTELVRSFIRATPASLCLT
jgi:transposase